jgi:hypothetical protein
MAIGPIGAHIYVNQNMQIQASKQTDFQNKLDLQNIQAAAVANEKDKDVQEVRPPEETYKIDPEHEHERQKKEEENGATQEQEKKPKKEKTSLKEEQNYNEDFGHLDIKI